MLIWHLAIYRLTEMKVDYISAFTTLTVNTQYVIGAIIIFMVTGRLVYEWRNNTASEVMTSVEHIIHEDRTPAPKHFDDGSL